MSRPLTCDACNSVIDAPVTPIKVAINNPAPEVMQHSHEELGWLMQIARQMGQPEPVEQTLLDFCGPVCLQLYTMVLVSSGKLTEEVEERL